MNRTSLGRAMPALPRVLMLLTVTTLFVLTATNTGAQMPASGRWRYFDSTEKAFTFGAVGMLWPKLGMDSLGITFTRLYAVPNPGDLLRKINSPDWWNVRLDSAFWYQAASIGYKVIGPMPNIARASYAARSIEHYLAYDTGSVQAMPFEHPPDPAIAVPVRDTNFMHGLVWPVQIAQADSAHAAPLLIAGGPQHTAGYIFEIGDRGLYRLTGLTDRFTSYRIGMTLSVTGNKFNNLNDTTLITYALLYRRVRTGQYGCKCSIYEKFDSIPVRAGDYRNADTISGTFREVSKLVNFIRGMEVRAHDTVFAQRLKITGGTGVTYLDTIIRTSDSVYNRDSLVQSFDSIPGCLCIPAARDTIARDTSGYPWHFTIVERDSIIHFHVQLYVPKGNEFAYGLGKTYFGAPDTPSACRAACTTRFNNGEFPPGSINESDAESDLDIRIYSTGVVPITFLRTRINQDLYDQLRAGNLNSFVRQDLDSLYAPADSVINKAMGRMALQDEPIHQRLRASGYMSRALQGMMRAKGDTVRQMWQNPPGNFDGYRLLLEDFDTTSVKTVQNMTRQDYHTIGGIGSYHDDKDPADRIPVFYANPDSMDPLVLYTLYRARDTMPRVFTDSVFKRHDTYSFVLDSNGRRIFDHLRTYSDTVPRNRMIAFNTMADYNAYTVLRQKGFGMFADYRGLVSSNIGPLVQQLARLVDVAKYKYARLGPPCTVWNMIQPGGWINGTADPRYEPGGDWDPYWSLFRPPTPEEITAQAWLVAACHADGCIYTDGVWDGSQLGFMDAYSSEHAIEYGTLKTANRDIWSGDTIGWTFPHMWVGFQSRFNAIRRVNREILKIDSAIHLTDLVFRQEQMSVHDPRQSFTAFPMVDTLIARHVQRYNLTGGYHDTTVADPKDSTYIELSHFLPGRRDSSGLNRGAHYLMIVNRRTYPTDTKTYTAFARTKGADSVGLGAIDVRRPLMRIKNTTGMILDSFIVEKVGHETDWPALRIAVDSLVALDFLEPGFGAVYRIVPIRPGVSERATAWNNAVRAENPSNSTTPRRSAICYERDSAVWLRVIDPQGAISREWLVSDAADTMRVTLSGGATRRRAHNILPALAILRGDSARWGGVSADSLGMMVVWERRDTNNEATVELAYLRDVPSRTEGITNDTLRHSLTQPRAFKKTWMTLAPAIVAVENQGFVVAWGSPDADGIELIGVRESPGLDYRFKGDSIPSYDTTHTMRAKTRILVNGQLWPADTVCQYPTLAFSPNVTGITTGSGTMSQTLLDTTGKEVPMQMPDIEHPQPFAILHLAYQQGWRQNIMWRIMYHVVGADFGSMNRKTAPRLWLAKGEHVSNNVDACEDRYPSIAVDSGLVGVAWQADLGTSTIALRFRDTLLPVEARRPFWSTPTYRFGDVNMAKRPPFPWNVLRAYGQPSLRQFPALRRNQLFGVPEGLIVWQWVNDPSNRKNRLVLYRFGDGAVDTSLYDGADPSVVLSSNLTASRSEAFTTSAILHRGSNAEKFTAPNIWGQNAFYYPAYVVNTPLAPSKTFRQPFAAGLSIVARYDIAPADAQTSPCSIPANGGIRTGIVIKRIPPYVRRRSDDTLPPPVPPFTEWGVPPTFFPVKPVGPKWVTTLDDASQVARTGDFLAGDSAVTIRRIIIGSDSIVPWLNTQPYDTAAGKSANIYMSVQLVRSRDGAVLWMGDTISARRVGHDTLDENLSVPVQSYAARDTAVYIRLYAAASPHVAYDVSGSFEFVDDDAGASAAKRIATPETGESPNATIGVAMIPNPVRPGAGELHILVESAGTATITVYDLLGNRVMVLPDLVADHTGEYVVPVDVSGLHDGLYVAEVRMGSLRGTTRFTMMR